MFGVGFFETSETFIQKGCIQCVSDICCYLSQTIDANTDNIQGR